MSREFEITNECATNVLNIRLSEKTKALLLFRAQLSDIYQNVSNVVECHYGESTDEFFKGFSDAHCQLDNELVKIISTRIEVISLEENYTEI